jgi:small neutral amino acid transporter SnatA (MarC family)
MIKAIINLVGSVLLLLEQVKNVRATPDSKNIALLAIVIAMVISSVALLAGEFA